MISLFQGIRAGVFTRNLCETNLRKFQAEKTATMKAKLHNQLGTDLFQRKMEELNFAIALLDYVLLVFDDLQLPLKIRRKEKTQSPAMSDLSEFPPFTDC